MLALRTTHTLLDHNPTNYWAGSSGGYFFPLWLGGQHVWGYTVLNLAAGALLQIVRSSKPVPLLENRFLKYIGTISYGMYVFHYVLMAWFQLLINDATSIIGHVGIAAAYMGILILVAHLSYRYFERPFLRLKERTTTAAAAHTVSPG